MEMKTIALILLHFFTLVHGDSIVSGNVFCDRCLHGRPSMWGVPIQGAKVLVHCRNRRGAILASPAFTNFLGAFVANFRGNHELQHCTSRLLRSPLKQCNVVVNTQESLKLEWRILTDSYYTVKPLYFRPVKPMPHCPISKPRVSPIFIPKPPPVSDTSSYCTADYWMNPMYKCHWRYVSPEDTIGKILGSKAEERYGRVNMMEALHKNTSLSALNDSLYSTAYNTLLVETVAALLNSYFSTGFDYSPLTVTRNFNKVITMGTPRDVTRLAERFRKANAGIGKGTCLLSVCKAFIDEAECH